MTAVPYRRTLFCYDLYFITVTKVVKTVAKYDQVFADLLYKPLLINNLICFPAMLEFLSQTCVYLLEGHTLYEDVLLSLPQQLVFSSRRPFERVKENVSQEVNRILKYLPDGFLLSQFCVSEGSDSACHTIS